METTTLLIALVCFLVGLALGGLLARFLSPQQKKQRELQETLQRTEDQHHLYQQDVADHFVKSAAMLKELSQNYRVLGEQFADSATRLSSPEVGRQVLEAASPAVATQSLPHTWSSTPAEPPKDYTPTTRGVLNERFGLDDHRDNTFGPNSILGEAADTGDDKESNERRDDPTYRVG